MAYIFWFGKINAVNNMFILFVVHNGYCTKRWKQTVSKKCLILIYEFIKLFEAKKVAICKLIVELEKEKL